ncbi:PREDICTED: vacuolar protein sorting-associated protein 13B-like [Papilio xuthus]|uniref:Vacuolar protein sorting-associated protein 13B-like n=1 Tax=Papilio xuthus TaxID=66420 RepID=A0AAJ6YZ68_PAPXU|nr:PREDICTED: vacuolar protein sorting-associated protein 13B-like [Papilio xuthus]
MFNIESYITPILLSYVEKYVKDFRPADAQVSLWGGGVALHNLVLKPDVLQQVVALPFTLVSGRIHELLIRVPWTKIMSEPITITIDTIECILSLHSPPEESPQPESPRNQVVEAPPGYMRALVRRVVSNISVRVHHLIVKYVQDDIVLSLNIKHLAVDSADSNWNPAFADIEVGEPALRRLVRLDDLTLCLDRADADGKIRFYQEPLLYRCQLDFRVLTRLVSAKRLRPLSVWVRAKATRLAGGASNEQLALLVRLLRERPPPPTPTAATPLLVPPPQAGSSTTSLEGVRTESWTEWAWSWLPASDEAEDVAPSVPVPVPLTFTVYFDDVSFTFKMMETDMNGKRRARPVLQLVATHTAVKFSKCAPTSLRLRAGARLLELRAHGKCVCGQLLPTHANYEPTIYLSSIEKSEEPWIWPEENFGGRSVETGLAVDEQFRASPEPNEASEGNLMETQWWKEVPQDGDNDELWEQMAPVVFIEYCHDRAPPDSHINPYDKPPLDFEYSDWAEECSISIRVQPLQLEVCGGLLHRVAAVADLALHLPPHQEPEQSIRTLTLEECEALSNNVPQRRCDVEVSGLVVRVWPWQHPPPSHRAASPLLLDFELPLAVATISAPLYTYRVCSAACQMPEDEALVWSCARAHVTLNVNGATACVRAADTPPKAIAHADIRATSHRLLHAHLFKHYATVHNSYTFNIREAGVCGSVARLTAAYEILTALRRARPSNLLNNTTLVYDALHDEEMVSLDASLEQLTLRGYATLGLRTNIISLHAVRASAIHTPKDGENKQAWLFSGPEAPTTSPYLRMAMQWETDAGVGAGSIARKEESEQLRTVEFIGAWLEPTAVSADPLLLAALAYLPRVTLSSVDSQSNLITGKSVSSSLHSMLRRPTPPSSSGRGGSRAGSGAEVHARPRSTASSAERTELMQAPPTPRPNDTRYTLGKKVAWWWSGEHAVQMHARLRRALACCELGLVQVYVPAQSVPARGSRPLRGMGGLAGLRDAIESHAANKPVLVFSLGHLTMHSNAMVKHLWNDIRHDGPTYIAAKPELTLDSFPWRVRIADVSCYTLEARRPTEGVRGALKDTRSTAPRALLGLLTTTVTLSIVTKSLSVRLPTPTQRAPHVAHDETKASPEPTAAPAAGGPVVSLGVHVHADTPPITLHLDQDQVGVLADALHCLTHLALLLRRSSVPTPAPTYPPVVPAINKSLIRSVSEQEERETPSERTPSDNRSDLIPIFEASAIKLETKTFIWVQWVISRATVAVSTGRARLAADVDDIIATVDLQPHYSQLKLKLASASLRHFRRSESDEWEAGAMGGRVLEAREPLDSKQDNHFLALTVTQAKISNLPASWREELHPKLLEQKSQGADSMWEVYVTLAPLEAVVQASVVRLAAAVMRLLRPRTAACPLRPPAPRPHSYLARTHAPLRSEWQLPFFYMSAGGLRLLLTEHGAESAEDDTLMLVIGKVTVNPHPENPICRRVVNACAETSGWVTGASAPDGRQYEALARGVALRSARFHQLVRQEVSEAEIMKGTGGENPALKWSQPTISPVITPIVHSVDVECVVAPAVVVCEEEGPTVACGPAFEINLASDCSIELGLHQLGLLVSLSDSMREALAHGQEDVDADEADEESNICPYSQLIPEPLSPWPDTAAMPPTASSATVTPTTQANSIPVSPWTARSESMRGGMDSGVASAASHCAAKYSLSDEPLGPIKKNVSIALADHRVDPWEHFELFVTMGVIEACLYAADTGGSELAPLRAREPPLSDHVPVPAPPSATPGPASTTASPNDNTAPEDQPRPIVSFKDIKETSKKEDGRESATAGSSIAPDDIKSTDIDKTHFDLTNPLPQARKSEGYLQMIHISLQQPNLYYWRKETQRTLQVSLFDAGVALGGGTTRRVLLSTERGNRDPLTDIPPALATLRATLPTTSISTTVISNARGTLQLDIERPVLFDVCTDRLIRLHTIIMLVNKQLKQEKTIAEEDTTQSSLRKLRKLMTNHGLANVSLNTGQVGVRGSAGSAGWTSASAHVTAAVRPDRFNARVLLRSMFASAGAPCDARRPVLLPVNVGATVVATWEGWRRSGGTTGGGSSGAGGVRGALYADAVTLDLRPGDLEALSALHHAVLQLQQFLKSDNQDSWNNDGEKKPSTSSAASAASINSLEDLADHYYKDDLRSGAFRLVRGGQVPMAYQVRASVGALAWRYPHPRALTRLVAFPVPGLVTTMIATFNAIDVCQDFAKMNLKR